MQGNSITIGAAIIKNKKNKKRTAKDSMDASAKLLMNARMVMPMEEMRRLQMATTNRKIETPVDIFSNNKCQKPPVSIGNRLPRSSSQRVMSELATRCDHLSVCSITCCKLLQMYSMACFFRRTIWCRCERSSTSMTVVEIMYGQSDDSQRRINCSIWYCKQIELISI